MESATERKVHLGNTTNQVIDIQKEAFVKIEPLCNFFKLYGILTDGRQEHLFHLLHKGIVTICFVLEEGNFLGLKLGIHRTHIHRYFSDFCVRLSDFEVIIKRIVHGRTSDELQILDS